jgi:hypothetical protein
LASWKYLHMGRVLFHPIDIIRLISVIMPLWYGVGGRMVA